MSNMDKWIVRAFWVAVIVIAASALVHLSAFVVRTADRTMVVPELIQFSVDLPEQVRKDFQVVAREIDALNQRVKKLEELDDAHEETD